MTDAQNLWRSPGLVILLSGQRQTVLMESRPSAGEYTLNLHLWFNWVLQEAQTGLEIFHAFDSLAREWEFEEEPKCGPW